MNVRLVCLAILAGFACLFFGVGAQAADVLRQLSGGQIRARFAGNVLTDGTHWRETYAPGGRLLVEAMGAGDASAGAWSVEGDRLCKRRPGILDECYAVWAEGDRVELRHPQYPPLAGFLRRTLPSTRHPSSPPHEPTGSGSPRPARSRG